MLPELNLSFIYPEVIYIIGFLIFILMGSIDIIIKIWRSQTGHKYFVLLWFQFFHCMHLEVIPTGAGYVSEWNLIN
jgi:hypothetical protein